MFRLFTTSAASTLLLSTLILPLAQADVAITYSDPTNPDQKMLFTVTSNKAAMNIPGPQEQSGRMIYDHALQKLYMVMDDRKQYMDMDAMMQSLGGLSDMLSGMMENMPEETKGKLGGLLGSLTGNKAAKTEPAAPQLVETGESDKVMGVSCNIATVNSAGQSTEMCLAAPSAIGISNGDFAIIQGMMAKQQQSAEQAAKMLGQSGFGFSPGVLDRVPLRIRQLSGPDAGSYSEIISTSDTADPANVVIPQGYTPVDMSALGG